jgi:hypothetical protein
MPPDIDGSSKLEGRGREVCRGRVLGKFWAASGVRTQAVLQVVHNSIQGVDSRAH